ncbi:hypothetical protein ABNX41_09990 [Rhodobacteraceae bacterium PA1-206B]
MSNRLRLPRRSARPLGHFHQRPRRALQPQAVMQTLLGQRRGIGAFLQIRHGDLDAAAQLVAAQLVDHQGARAAKQQGAGVAPVVALARQKPHEHILRHVLGQIGGGAPMGQGQAARMLAEQSLDIPSDAVPLSLRFVGAFECPVPGRHRRSVGKPAARMQHARPGIDHIGAERFSAPDM